MVAVPVATPVTTPTELTVALAGAPLLNTPPLIERATVPVAPGHTEVVPERVPASGNPVTVTTFVALAFPQPLVTL